MGGLDYSTMGYKLWEMGRDGEDGMDDCRGLGFSTYQVN